MVPITPPRHPSPHTCTSGGQPVADEQTRATMLRQQRGPTLRIKREATLFRVIQHSSHRGDTPAVGNPAPTMNSMLRTTSSLWSDEESKGLFIDINSRIEELVSHGARKHSKEAEKVVTCLHRERLFHDKDEACFWQHMMACLKCLMSLLGHLKTQTFGCKICDLAQVELDSKYVGIQKDEKTPLYKVERCPEELFELRSSTVQALDGGHHWSAFFAKTKTCRRPDNCICAHATGSLVDLQNTNVSPNLWQLLAFPLGCMFLSAGGFVLGMSAVHISRR